jgi:crotonobetainyl-CoA:carnitine CoA-transferase CaiB-like acyl-CoA transferase
LFALFAGVLDHPEWATDPRFRTNPDRVHNQDGLYRLIEAIVCQRTTAQMQTALDTAGVPNAPIQSIDQVLAHEQTRALGVLQNSPDGKIALIGSPLSLDGERLPFRRSPPELGADTDQVLGSERDIAPAARRS